MITIIVKFMLYSLQVHPEGKYVVDLDKGIDMSDVSFHERSLIHSINLKYNHTSW